MCVNDGVKVWVGPSLVPKLFSTKQGKIGLVNINSIFHFIPCGCKNCDIMFVRRRHCLPRRFRITMERRSWKEKLLSVTETLEQTYWHFNFPLSVVKLSNTSQMFMKLLTTFQVFFFFWPFRGESPKQTSLTFKYIH